MEPSDESDELEDWSVVEEAEAAEAAEKEELAYFNDKWFEDADLQLRRHLERNPDRWYVGDDWTQRVMDWADEHPSVYRKPKWEVDGKEMPEAVKQFRARAQRKQDWEDLRWGPGKQWGRNQIEGPLGMLASALVVWLSQVLPAGWWIIGLAAAFAFTGSFLWTLGLPKDFE